MKAKREVKRMCVGCGEMFDKRSLIRVVKSPEGEISIDLTGKKNGRGAYICNSTECLKKAKKRKSIERAFSMKIDDSVYDEMEEEDDYQIMARRIIAKITTLVAFSYRNSIGAPFIYPDISRSYVENFLYMLHY